MAATLQPFREQLAGLLEQESLTDHADEEALDQLSQVLRRLWMQNAHHHGDAHLKSPADGVTKRLPLGSRATFSYERCLYPNHLEARGKTYRRNRHPAWTGSHLVTRCGMAAIIALLHALMRTVKPTPKRPLSLAMFGGYYETKRALRLFPVPLFFSRQSGSQSALLKSIADPSINLLLIEP
ncbi:MAG: hypothetical protein HQL53_10980, partial [Magnetococcales bacterium]|nr:hypothetical protein [Magnetococcales bacterium]